MPDLHYEDPSLAAIYDLNSGWSIDRDFYLALAGGSRKSILDLGCGTGLLCEAYAALGHDVTGVDPAKAMIEVATRKPHGSEIEWIEATAQEFRSEKKFDLIIMTGNAFQVFLTDADILAAFATMRVHLADDGLIAFESRNPAIDWPARWNRDCELRSGDAVIHQSRRVLKREGDRIAFETHYLFPDKKLVSYSELRFLTRSEVEQRLWQSGLKVEAVYGDWESRPFDEATSEDMIFLVRSA